MKTFVIVDDYTSFCLWDEFIYEILPKLPSKPQGWKDRCPEIPEGEWRMRHGMHTMATAGAYEEACIPKPKYEQLPAIFCLTEDGIVGKYRVTTEQTEAFVKAHL